MPRTPIPDHLIHRPEEVERDGHRFDYLCQLAEEVAFPVVKNALFREFEETTKAGGGILTEEARHALEALADDAAILEDLDEEKVLADFQKSLNEALTAPDEKECREHTRGLSQLLMSGWLETLRAAQSEAAILALSDHLLPEPRMSGFSWLMEKFGAAKSELNELLEDVAWFAVNKEDVSTIMTRLREKLFPESRLVELPFELVMMGTPDEPALVMPRPLYERLSPITVAAVPATAVSAMATNTLAARTASTAINSVSEPLPRQGYRYFAKMASLKAKDVEQQVQHALAATE
jgi:hypothetical protein